MVYLEPGEYPVYGLDAATSDAWVLAASAMIDAFCLRPTLAAASYTERMRVGRRTGSVRLSYGPLVSVVSARARFGCSESLAGYGAGGAGGLLGAMFGGLAALTFCAPGSWTALDVTTFDVSAGTGIVTLPLNVLGVPYSEVEMTYTAGFAAAAGADPVAAIPVAVKVACAQIVKNAQATPGLNVRSSRMDTLATEYFSGSLMDPQVTAMLRPYVAERLGA